LVVSSKKVIKICKSREVVQRHNIKCNEVTPFQVPHLSSMRWIWVRKKKPL